MVFVVLGAIILSCACFFGFILIRIVLAIVMFCVSVLVFAQEQADSYTVIVPVENQSELQRQSAFETALHNLVNANPAFNSVADSPKLFDHPELYVESFSYQTDADQEDALKIIVHFDRESLSPFFQQAHTVQSQQVNLQISGVTSAQVLNQMTNYLDQMNVIKFVMIKQVAGENVLLSVILQGNVANFIQALMADQHFVSQGTEDPQDASALHFKWIEGA